LRFERGALRLAPVVYKGAEIRTRGAEPRTMGVGPYTMGDEACTQIVASPIHDI